MGVKNRAKQVVVDNKVLERHNFYGFNDMMWKSVKADSIEAAEKEIRRALQINDKVKLTVKPL